MNIKIKYFGMIAEQVHLDEEMIDFNEKGEINLRNYFETKFPILKGSNYKIAVNQNLRDKVESLSGVSEIALLPPFAGG